MPSKPTKSRKTAPHSGAKSAKTIRSQKSVKSAKSSKRSTPKPVPKTKLAAAKKASKSAAPVTPKSLDKIREGLLQELSRLRKRLGVFQSDDTIAEAANVGDIADVATNYESREILREIQHTEEDQLRQVEGALMRIEAGTYGQCARCDGKIEAARLEALPHAPTCIACRRREERGEFTNPK